MNNEKIQQHIPMRHSISNDPVLLIEDEPIQRQILSSQLQINGFSVIEASNGSERLSRWRNTRISDW